MLAIPATPAAAHPLGNFTVNHYNGIALFPDRVDVLAVVDIAEIPTAQEFPAVDTDDSGSLSDDERASYAEVQCQALAATVTADVDGTPLAWSVSRPSLETVPGVADLPTLRLSCELSAAADLSGPSAFTLADEFRPGRIGWREITAVGDGVRLLQPPVPAETISDELRAYPEDLLLSPLNVASVTLRTEPGEGSTGSQEFRTGASADPFTRFMAAADTYLEDLIGPELTPLVGVLALLLAILLGAGHALLPGHGKTVMAAYLAGRRGSRRDALLVGATVTGTHTAGVLVLGVAISVSSAVAGEEVLRWLGVISGLLVAAIGIALLRSALRSRRTRASELEKAGVLVGAGGLGAGHDHDHGAGHDHDHEHAPEREHTHSHGFGRAHSHGPGDGYSRSGLIGMGIAGGLVPSPSALIVLLASIGLGRTVFGVALVFAYGIGMAGTLTAVGLLLVRLRNRLVARSAGRMRRSAAAIAAALPVLTAVLVLVVGVILALRGLVSTA
ncbi:MAG: High-affinity nickel-transporter [Geodermatophilaceae bacterium]|nr:High-affinity nickel-transporter [Geodermatophilaceae bacterium]